MDVPPWASEELTLPAQLEDPLTEAPANGAFALITTLATRMLRVPVAAISLAGPRGRWIHSLAGLEEKWTTRQIPAVSATFGLRKPVVTGDARDNPHDSLALAGPGPPGLRFYAGVPLVGRNGARLGVISVMDRVPQPWSAHQAALLEHLGALVLKVLGQNGAGEPLVSRSKSNLYRDLFEHGADIVYAHDLTGRFIAINRAVEFLTGYSQREVLEMSILDLVHPEDRFRIRRYIWELAGGGDAAPVELAFQRHGGEPLSLEVSTRLLFEHGRPMGVEGFARDVTRHKLELAARQQAEQRLLALELQVQQERQQAAVERRDLAWLVAYQARHDMLTGLPNRRHLMEFLDASLQRARRRHGILAVLHIDLDRMNQINDTLGHAIGDRLIRHVARRLTAELQPEDRAARMGGDEFVVVLAGIRDPDSAVSRSRQLLDLLRAPCHINDREVFVTASIGVSLFPHDGNDPDTLLANADRAMCRAKDLGKNTVQMFKTVAEPPATNSFELETELRRALENRELDLCYQPQVRLDGRLDGFEVLLAWRNPQRGRLPASRFIAIAEESGMIVEIGSWVLEQACLQNARWQQAGYRPMRIAVNVSPLQFARADFFDTVATALRHAGLKACYLDLELTENSFMRNLAESTRSMRRLRELGVGLSIDDFGTG